MIFLGCLGPNIWHSRNWKMPLLGEDGHITEVCVLNDEHKIFATFVCNHCGDPLPQAGLGLSPSTKDVLCQHLVECDAVPIELQSQISGSAL